MAMNRPRRGRGSPLLRELRQAERRIRRGEPLDRARVRAWLAAARSARASGEDEAPALVALVRVLLRRHALNVIGRGEEAIARGNPLVEPVLSRRIVAELRGDLDAAAELGGRVRKLRVRLAELLRAQLSSRLAALELTIRESRDRDAGAKLDIVATLWDELIDAEALESPNLEPLALRIADAQSKLERQARTAPTGLNLRRQRRPTSVARALGTGTRPHPLAALRRIGIGQRMLTSPGVTALLAFVRRIGDHLDAFLKSLRIRGRTTGDFRFSELPFIQKTVLQLDWIAGEPDPWKRPDTLANVRAVTEALAEQGVQIDLVRGREVPAERYNREEARSAADFAISGPLGPVILERLEILDGAVALAQRPGFVEVIVAPTQQRASNAFDSAPTTALRPLVHALHPSASSVAYATPPGHEQRIEVPSRSSGVEREQTTPGPATIGLPGPALATTPSLPRPLPLRLRAEGTTSAPVELPSAAGEDVREAAGTAGPLPAFLARRTIEPPGLLETVVERQVVSSLNRPTERIRVEIDWVAGQDPMDQQAVLEHARDIVREFAIRGVELELVRGREVPMEHYRAGEAREARDFVLPSIHGPISLADLDILDRAVPVEQRPGFLRVLVAPRRGTSVETAEIATSLGASAIAPATVERRYQPMTFISRSLPPTLQPDAPATSAAPWPTLAAASARPAQFTATGAGPSQADDVSVSGTSAPPVHLIASDLVRPASRTTEAVPSLAIPTAPLLSPVYDAPGSGIVTRHPRPGVPSPEFTSPAVSASPPGTVASPTRGIVAQIPGLALRSTFSAPEVEAAGPPAWLGGEGDGERRPLPTFVHRRVAFRHEHASPAEGAAAQPAAREAQPRAMPELPSIQLPTVAGHAIGDLPAGRGREPYGLAPFVGLASDVVARVAAESGLTTAVLSSRRAVEPASSTPGIQARTRELSMDMVETDRPTTAIARHFVERSETLASTVRATPSLVRHSELSESPVTPTATAADGDAATRAAWPLGWSETIAHRDRPLLVRRTYLTPSGPLEERTPEAPNTGAGAEEPRSVAPELTALSHLTSFVASPTGWAPALTTILADAPGDRGINLTLRDAAPAETTVLAGSPAASAPILRFARAAIGREFVAAPRRPIAPDAAYQAGELAVGPTIARAMAIPRQQFAPESSLAPTWISAPWLSADVGATVRRSEAPLTPTWISAPTLMLADYRASGRPSESPIRWESVSDSAVSWQSEPGWRAEWIGEIARTAGQSSISTIEWLRSTLSEELPMWVGQAAAPDGDTTLQRLRTSLDPADPLGVIARTSAGDRTADSTEIDPAAPSLADIWFAVARAGSQSPREAPLPPASAGAAMPTHFSQRRMVLPSRQTANVGAPFGAPTAPDDGASGIEPMVPRWAIDSEPIPQPEELPPTVSVARMQEIARAAVNRAITGTAAQSGTTTTTNVTTANAGEPATGQQPNLDSLARQVYGIIKRRLAVEQERFGRGRVAKIW